MSESALYGNGLSVWCLQLNRCPQVTDKKNAVLMYVQYITAMKSFLLLSLLKQKVLQGENTSVLFYAMGVQVNRFTGLNHFKVYKSVFSNLRYVNLSMAYDT